MIKNNNDTDMKIKLCLLFSIAFLKFYAQNVTQYSVPDFAPKSPEAAAFLKYGEYPVDLSTGTASISVPLYTLNSGDFNMPISVGYHASGIKANQEATWVGLGWNLNYGAQIILSVRDDVDEESGFPNIPTANDLNYWDEHPYAFNSPYFSQLSQSRVKDVYQFSSPTANGSFYLLGSEAIVFPPDAFKVKKNGANFIITDSSGILYIFESTKETTYRTSNHNASYTSAWYVDKIQIPHKDVITFTYQDDGTVTETSLSQRKDITTTQNDCGCPQPGNLNTAISPLISLLDITTTHVKKISEITFNSGQSKVLFIKQDGRQDLQNGSANGYLDRIEVRHKDGSGNFQFVKGYQFLYSYFNQAANGADSYKLKRLKLRSISSLLEGDDSYRFEYSDLALPAKDSKSKDYFGYYNGKPNSDLIPRQQLTAPYVITVGSADRNVNPDVVQAGMLKEIQYPTKGWTKFNYGANKIWGPKYSETFFSCAVNGTGVAGSLPPPAVENPDGSVSEGFMPSCGASNPANCIKYAISNFTISQAQNKIVNINIQNYGSTSDQVVKYKFCRISIYSAGNLVYTHYTNRNTQLSIPITFSGNCTLFLEAYGADMHIDAGVNIVNDPIYTNLDTAGLRIESIQGYNYDGILISKKEFNYNSVEQANRSSGRFVNEMKLNFTSNPVSNFSIGTCSGGEIGNPNLTAKTDLQKSYSISSNSQSGIEGNTIIYEYVKETSIDSQSNLSNGYSQYKFTVEGDWTRPDAGVSINTPWKRGKILEKSDYRIVGTEDYIVRKENNIYAEDPSKVSYVKGFKVIKHSSMNIGEGSNPQQQPSVIASLQSCGIPQNVSESYIPVSINYPVKWQYLQNSQITEYFYNDNVAEGNVTTSTSYFYENPNHFNATKIVKTNSEGANTVIKNYYVPDVTSISSLPNGNISGAMLDAIGVMKQQNAISLVQTDELKNGENLFSKRILFKNWNFQEPINTIGGAPQYLNLIAPEIVQSAKGTTSFEDRIIYKKLDTKGNIIEVTQENGKPISIIWGYNNTLAVAKLENATYTSISASAIADIQSKSNTGTEAELIAALNSLRSSLPNAMITTYTYKPLVGVTSITDPKGMKTTYEYDTFGRLKEVRDNDGKLLSENEYHYKN